MSEQALDNPRKVKLRRDLLPLKKLLLSAGGMRLQLPGFVNEEVTPLEAEILYGMGAFFPGEDARFVPGEPSACHENAARLDDGVTRRRFTGFALSEDGCWRVHSWLMTPDGVIETTGPRTLYFGIRWPGCSSKERP